MGRSRWGCGNNWHYRFRAVGAGDITYLELPEVGDAIALDQAFGIVESVKAANDIFSPVDGEVVARNDDALTAPETLNQSPYDRAWLVRVRLNSPNNCTLSWTPQSTTHSRKPFRTSSIAW